MSRQEKEYRLGSIIMLAIKSGAVLVVDTMDVPQEILDDLVKVLDEFCVERGYVLKIKFINNDREK